MFSPMHGLLQKTERQADIVHVDQDAELLQMQISIVANVYIYIFFSTIYIIDVLQWRSCGASFSSVSSHAFALVVRRRFGGGCLLAPVSVLVLTFPTPIWL